MKTILAVVSMLALSACATPEGHHVAGEPKLAPGFAPRFAPLAPKVYVVNGSQGKIVVVDQEPIVVATNPGGHGTQVRWTIESPGYEFDQADGIKIEQTIYGPPNQVGQCSRRDVGTPGDNRGFTCDDANKQRGKYRYSIKIKNKATGEVLSSDPTYMND